MVTHSSTSRPVQCLCMAERTGCPVLTDLWSYVVLCAHGVFTNLDSVVFGVEMTAIEIERPHDGQVSPQAVDLSNAGYPDLI
jgi:hypothetical protein